MVERICLNRLSITRTRVNSGEVFPSNPRGFARLNPSEPRRHESGGSIERKGTGSRFLYERAFHDPIRPTGRAEEVRSSEMNQSARPVPFNAVHLVLAVFP